MNDDKALDEAKKRLEEGRAAREKRRKQIFDSEEPDNLVSGNFDEVELKRNEKHGDKDE